MSRKWPLCLGCHPGQLGATAHQTGKQVPLGGHRLPHSDEQPLHGEDLLQLLVAGVQEGLVLELVDPVVEVSQDREEAVYQGVDDPVEQQRRVVDRRPALLVAMPHLGEGRRLVSVDGDEEAFGIEAVHLDQPVLIGDGAVDDQEHEVVVVVELRTLAEVLRILQSERMELEDIAQYGEVLLPRPGQVYPKEAAAREQTLEIVAAEMQLANLFFMNDMTDRGSRDRRIARSIVRAPAVPATPRIPVVESSAIATIVCQIVLVDRFAASAAGWLDAAARDAVGRHVRNIRVGPAEAGSPPSAQGIRAIAVLAVVVWRLFHAAGRTRPMRRSAHRLALTGVDSQITEALLQAFSASEL